MTTPEAPHSCDSKSGTSRRDFLTISAIAAGGVGVGTVAIKVLNSMNPAADVQALSSIEVDVSNLQPGTTQTVMWRGKPVFIRRRTPQEIEAAQKVPLNILKDPQTDQERFAINPEYLVVIGVCTHLGCIPNERQNMTEPNGGGWLCACHGSIYDTSGRIVSGPAPTNLPVPPYNLTDTKLKIG
ncbi:MAG: ubiquinol-cytochrome c reductase iron-sulfur subunit [Alphaproteobacteria bacterium]|nr:ubiquinol-cytochrome c reductase iron-sulfur subunit [Alphaproteobacteria bacterium]